LLEARNAAVAFGDYTSARGAQRLTREAVSAEYRVERKAEKGRKAERTTVERVVVKLLKR
jgi:hypothetical protein